MDAVRGRHHKGTGGLVTAAVVDAGNDLDLVPGLLFRCAPGGGPDASRMTLTITGGRLRAALDLPRGEATEAVLALFDAQDRTAVLRCLQEAAARDEPCQAAVTPRGREEHLMTVQRAGPGLLHGVLTPGGPLAAAHSAATRSEERFRKAFQASPGLFAISRPDDGRHIDVNDTWLRVMGWRREEVIGRTAAELGIWADPQDRARVVGLLKKHGSVRDFGTRFRTRTGTVREFLVAGEIIELDEAPHLLLVAHDVTERLEAQRALARLNEDLEARVAARTEALQVEARRREAAETRLRGIVDGLADAIVTSDGEGRILSFNRAAERLFGWTAAEIVGADVSRLMPESYALRHDQSMRDYMRTRESAILGLGRELPALRRDGSVVPVELSLSHLTIHGEDIFTAVMRDITERKEAEAALQEAKEQAERANQAKSAFLSSMSHELRTPMNAILGFAQLLSGDMPPGLAGKRDEYVGHITQAGNHLLTLINDVLDLSRIESGRLSVSLEPLAVDEVVSRCLTLLSAQAERFDVTLQPFRDDSGGVPVWADSVRLGQIVLNLGSNAIKYNRRGGSVTLHCAPAPERAGFLRLSVRDTGRGIPADRHDDLFQPFNRLGAENGPVEGTGIGLAIARQLVEMMGGLLGLESTLGEGSTFWIDLPMASAPVDAAPADGAGADDAGGGAAAGGGRTGRNALTRRPWTILYIDDVPGNVRLLAGVLSRYPNIRLLTAATAAAGLAIAAEQRPDAVVLDINLPESDGYHVLTELRADPATAETPIIALTARAAPRDVDRGLRAGFDAYLAKPLDISRFLLALNTCLTRVCHRQG